MNQDKFGITRQSAPAAGGAQERSNQCEVTASLARGQEATAEQVSPAVSPAISPSTVENYKTETDGDQSGSQSGTGNGKPDCYKCKHRRSLTYSAHSECVHPALDGKGRVLAVVCVLRSGSFLPLGLTGRKHGILSGWFTWPIDYDPTWLETCAVFEVSNSDQPQIVVAK